MIRDYLSDAIAAYEAEFGATNSLQAFKIFMDAHSELSSRKNLAGHCTGSAIVWHKESDSILRVHHAKLNRWVFSAGGHIDDGEMPWQAAIRELREETGIVATPLNTAMPLIFDAQPIPASVKKSEPAHWHYDLIYLFAVDHKPEIHADPAEISKFRWVNVDDVTPENSPVDLRAQMLHYAV
jgi:8-oxo-dGTP pyrophosphatase MutT (NUDIX family)